MESTSTDVPRQITASTHVLGHGDKFRMDSAEVEDVCMIGPIDPNQEISDLMTSDSTPVLFKKALELFMAADPSLARDVADRLDELCERRFASLLETRETGQDVVTSDRHDSGELNERCDALTGRLMKYLGKLVVENQRSGAVQLVLFAAARSFICTSVSVSGVDDGLRGARLIFEDALRELTPVLRNMPEVVK